MGIEDRIRDVIENIEDAEIKSLKEYAEAYPDDYWEYDSVEEFLADRVDDAVSAS